MLTSYMSIDPTVSGSLFAQSLTAFDDSIQRRKSESPRLSSTELLVSGAISGALAKSAIAPMDRVKILFQTNPNRRFTITSAVGMARNIYSQSGLKSFWRGHTATLMRVVPYSATNFFVFDRTRHFLEPTIGQHIHPAGVKFISGAISGSAAVCVTYPLETLRARLAVDLDGKYSRGYIEAVKTVIKSDGFLSLYSGLKPTLVGIVPYAGTSFTVYETLKTDETTFTKRFLIGAIAGVTAQATTYPLDVVRRRMQVSPLEYPSVMHAFRKVYVHEGISRGLYKGLSMNIIKGPMAVAISLNANDHLKNFFLSRQDLEH
jgi:solute carrier family 25 protein 42